MGEETREEIHDSPLDWVDGTNYLIVGSNGGAAEHPQWYLNLTADPHPLTTS